MAAALSPGYPSIAYHYTFIQSKLYPGLLLLSHFSRVQLCATPQMAAHQVLPSLGFSRQEHWSGLLLPSLISWSYVYKYMNLYFPIQSFYIIIFTNCLVRLQKN